MITDRKESINAKSNRKFIYSQDEVCICTILVEGLLTDGMYQYSRICMRGRPSMKKNEPTKSSPETPGKTGVLRIIRVYFSVIRLIHKDLGALRIIIAYLFVVFALLSLLFTISVPVAGDFMTPTGAAKAQSRAITGFMAVINIVIYGMIMNWRKGNAIRTTIRIALIGVALYLDTFLILTLYILIRNGV